MTAACPDDLPPPTDLSHLSDEDFLALCPQGEHAPGPADPDHPPLWEEMLEAVIAVPAPKWSPAGKIAAAQIRAVRDWLVPEEPEAPAGDGEPWPQAYQQRSDAMWEQRQQLRALLTTEAERAERGQ